LNRALFLSSAALPPPENKEGKKGEERKRAKKRDWTPQAATFFSLDHQPASVGKGKKTVWKKKRKKRGRPPDHPRAIRRAFGRQREKKERNFKQKKKGNKEARVAPPTFRLD